jgi:hypothetical protein
MITCGRGLSELEDATIFRIDQQEMDQILILTKLLIGVEEMWIIGEECSPSSPLNHIEQYLRSLLKKRMEGGFLLPMKEDTRNKEDGNQDEPNQEAKLCP